MDWLNWLPLMLTSLVSAINFFFLWKRATPEIEKIRSESEKDDADAVESYANAARVVAEELTKVRDEVKVLRGEIYERDKIILQQRIMIDDLKDWSTRLIFQMKSINKDIEPTPFKPGSNDIMNV